MICVTEIKQSGTPISLHLRCWRGRPRSCPRSSRFGSAPLERVGARLSEIGLSLKLWTLTSMPSSALPTPAPIRSTSTRHIFRDRQPGPAATPNSSARSSMVCPIYRRPVEIHLTDRGLVVRYANSGPTPDQLRSPPEVSPPDPGPPYTRPVKFQSTIQAFLVNLR
jgi:hypothetical protein